MLDRLRRRSFGLRSFVRRLRSPVTARHVEHSLLFSLDDDPSRPSDRLLGTAIAAVSAARSIRLDDVSARIEEGPLFPSLWPGEHYRLLAALVHVLQPQVVIEIGTYTGLSALSMKTTLPPSSRLVTFDITAWQSVPKALLNASDFADGRLSQIVDDITVPLGAARYSDLLASADLIFIDAAKDSVMESRLLNIFDSMNFRHSPIIALDDIRLRNMLSVWRSISRPKLDLTSFGHWSGTGLVDWTPPPLGRPDAQ